MVNTKFNFPYQLHQMLEDAEQQGFEHIVSWLPGSTKHFKLHDVPQFEKHIMKRYFPTMGLYKSFLRQLNIYGFTRVTTTCSINPVLGRGAYTHPLLERYNLDICNQMVRTKIKRNSFKVNEINNENTKKTTIKSNSFSVGSSTSSSTSSTMSPAEATFHGAHAQRRRVSEYIPRQHPHQDTMAMPSFDSSNSDLSITNEQQDMIQIEAFIKLLQGANGGAAARRMSSMSMGSVGEPIQLSPSAATSAARRMSIMSSMSGEPLPWNNPFGAMATEFISPVPIPRVSVSSNISVEMAADIINIFGA